jgi:hypothetical protein
VTTGQETITVQNFAEALLSREIKDVRNSTVITLSLKTYSLFDDLNRPGRPTYLDNSYVDYLHQGQALSNAYFEHSFTIEKLLLATTPLLFAQNHQLPIDYQ